MPKIIGFCAKNGYEILKICEDEFCLLLNKNNPLAQKTKIDPKEMVGLQFTANTYFASLLSVKESAKATKRAILQLPPTVNIPQYLAHHENNAACFLKKSVQSSEYVQNGVLVLKDYTFEDGENAKYQYIYHRGNKAAETVGEYLKEYFAEK